MKIPQNLRQFKRAIIRHTAPNFYFTTKSKFRGIINSIRFNSLSDPFEILMIDPNSIEYVTSEISALNGLGQVVPGEWDKNRKNINSIIAAKGLRQRYCEGRKWKNTDYFLHARKAIEENGTWFGHSTLEDVIEFRCKYLDEMYESMKKDGYKYQPNTAISNRNAYAGRNKSGYPGIQPEHKLEPLVCIGRDGDFLLRDGRHRVTMARILDLNEIPVNVLARHKAWQCLRDNVSQHGFSYLENPKQMLSHPDLQDLY